MKFRTIRHILCCATIALAASLTPSFQVVYAQDNWAADDNALEARKIERYQQLVDQSPEKSYAFNQLMATVGKGGQYQKLLADYEKKAAEKPQNFNLQMILGHIYQHGGRTNDAIQAYQKALTIKKTPLAYMSIAAAEQENRNFEPAVANYEAAANLNPTREQKQEIWRALAEIAIYRRDMDGAKKYFAELIKLEPNSLFVRRELSQIYAQNRLYADAREVLEDGLKLSASSSDKEQIQLDIAMLYEQEGNDDEALKRYEDLSAKLGSSHWMQRELSARIIDIHRRKGDVKGLTQALENSWKSPSYQQHLELASLNEEIGNNDRALAHLQKAISSSPKLPEAHEKLIQFYHSHGQTDKMFAAKAAQIKAIPDNPDYRFELYEAWIQQRKIDNAIGVLDEIVKTFSNDFDVQRKAAEMYEINNRAQKAQAVFENWVKKHPNDLQGLEALGDHYFYNDEKEKALSTWKKIENLPMDKATKLETLARIYDEHNYSDEAEALYVKLLATNPKDCQTNSDYAELLTRNGNHVKAIEAWQKLTEVCPTVPVRKVATQQLASLYTARGMQRTAMSQYQGKCESSPNDLNTVLMYASLANALGTPNEAIPTLQNFVERNPDKPEAMIALNELQSASGDTVSARKTLEIMASRSEADRRDALIAMADLDVEEGNLEAAHNHLAEALKLNSNDADTHEKLGDILLKRRLYEEAANNYETAFQIDNRNFHVAFKTATCLSILGKTKEADALYVQIVSEAPDETLAMKAANRAIDDHTWLGTLDELSTTLLPNLRSGKHRELFLEILLKIASAQIEPYTTTLLAREQQYVIPARHKLRELSEKYSSLISEALVHKDPFINNEAISLAQWLASPTVVAVLSQKIEETEDTEKGRELQLKLVRAIAHAQSPSAVPVLQKLLSSKYNRALREEAVWALGLIQSDSASNALKEALSINFDSLRALAIIGLGRQKTNLSDIHKLLKEDPSPLVKDAAAWALAYAQYENAYGDMRTHISSETKKSYYPWIENQISSHEAAPHILEMLWCNQNRDLASKLIHSMMASNPLSGLTQAEARMDFISYSSYYQSYFKIDEMLSEFTNLTLNDTHDAQNWVLEHQAEFAQTIQKISLRTDAQSEQCQAQMLEDLLSPASDAKFVFSPENQNILLKSIESIAPQLQNWALLDGSYEKKLRAGLSIKALAMTPSGDALAFAQKILTSEAPLNVKIDATAAIASLQSPQSREAIRKLATDKEYLIRAEAVRHLNENDSADLEVLKKAIDDDYLVVSQTAKKKLAQ